MLKKITKKQWWMMLASALIIVGALIIASIMNQPKDLGDKLEYIGKKIQLVSGGKYRYLWAGVVGLSITFISLPI